MGGLSRANLFSPTHAHILSLALTSSLYPIAPHWIGDFQIARLTRQHTEAADIIDYVEGNLCIHDIEG
jgi:hypothetical protein